MEKIYKGYELMWAVSKGLLNTTQKVSTVNREYMNCTIESILSNKVSDIMNLDFVLMEDDIDNVKELYISNKTKSIGEDEVRFWTGRNLDIAMANKINELIRAVNKAKKED